MRILYEGEWRRATPLGIGMPDGTLMPVKLVGAPTQAPSPEYTDPAFTASAAFQPLLQADGEAAVTWTNATTGAVVEGLSPELSAGTWLLQGDVDQIHTINLGFSHLEDSGRHTPGASYNREPRQPVTRVENLPQMTGLVRFLAATPTLTGHLDLTGLSSLEYVECYLAKVTSVDLTGCTSLIRLCLEQNAVSEIDLTPVRETLRDLRLAGQSSPQVTVNCDGPLTQLYHYCTRGNPHCVHVPVDQMPVVEQWWVWRTNMTSSPAPVSTLSNSVLAYDNELDQASVDRILAWIDTGMTRNNGNIRLDDGSNSAPSAAGLASAANARARGVGVTHN